MAIAFQYLDRMVALGLLVPGSHILDVGSSNLYEATPEKVAAFMARFGVRDDVAAERISEASARKTAFAGELLELCGFQYESIDMAPGHRTTVFDLNEDRLPRDFRGTFDLVLNFGTTEHVLSQAHAFQVIHEATKPDAFIYHQLPVAGFTDHGYFVYTGRFFFDLAGHNEYEVLHCSFSQAQQSALSAPVRSYATYFPALAETRACEGDAIPDVAMDVIYRKQKDEAFKYPFDFSTSVGTPQRRERKRRFFGLWRQ